MVEQVAHFHNLQKNLDEHDPRFFKADELGDSESEGVLLRLKMDFSAIAPEMFEHVKSRIKLYTKPEYSLTYKVEISGQVVDMLILEESNKDALVNKSIQIFDHMKESYVDEMQAIVQSFTKIPQEDRKVMCEALESIKKDLAPLLEILEGIPASDENVRMSHGDLHHGNFLIDDQDKVFLIDFDLAGLNYIYYDLSLVLEHMSGRPEYQKENKDGFEANLDMAVKKYLEVRPLSVSAEVLKERIRIFRPMMKIFWLKVFSFFMAGGDKGFIYFYKVVLLPHYREVCDKILKK